MSHYPKDVPFEVPEGWCWCKMMDVCHIAGRIGFRGYTKADLVPLDGAITLSPSNIVEGKTDFSHCTYISWSKYEESPEIMVFPGDILLVKTGSSYGKVALVDSLPQPATINPQFVVLKHIKIDRFYLTYLLQSEYARKKYEEFVIGTAIPTFTQEALNNMRIPLPPYAEQRRIVIEVEKWFDTVQTITDGEHSLAKGIESCKSKILDLAIHGKLVPQDPSDEPAIELLKRFNPDFKPSDNLHYAASVPDGWQLCHIQDIASVELGKTLDRLKNSGEEKPYLCALNVKWDSFDLSTVKTIRIASSEKERYAVKPGDLLVCEGGDVGRSAIWTEHIEMYYQNALHRIRFKSQDICQEFFLYVLRNYKDRGIIDDVCKGVTIKHFTGQVFKSLDLPIPPLKEQKRIVDCVNAYCNILEEIAAGIK